MIAYTIKGAWRYLEHEWVSRAGGTVYETAGSAHTPESCGDEEAEVFFVIVGELLFLDPDGKIVARENHLTSTERYLAYCREHGIVRRTCPNTAEGRIAECTDPLARWRSRSSTWRRPSAGSARDSDSCRRAAHGR